MSEALKHKGRSEMCVEASPAADRKAVWVWALSIAVFTLWVSSNAFADQAVSCGGFAMLGGAQMTCSHVVPKAPTQFCTFSWALMTTDGGLDNVAGSFVLPPGSSNMMVYQGAGFSSALSNPIVLCQGKKSR